MGARNGDGRNHLCTSETTASVGTSVEQGCGRESRSTKSHARRLCRCGRSAKSSVVATNASQRICCHGQDVTNAPRHAQGTVGKGSTTSGTTESIPCDTTKATVRSHETSRTGAMHESTHSTGRGGIAPNIESTLPTGRSCSDQSAATPRQDAIATHHDDDVSSNYSGSRQGQIVASLSRTSKCD